MPTAALPDLNHLFMKVDDLAAAIAAENADLIWVNANAVNSALPPDLDDDGRPKWRVLISTAERAAALADRATRVCYHCQAEHNLPRVRVLDMWASRTDRLYGSPELSAPMPGQPRTLKKWRCLTSTLRPDGDRTEGTPSAGCGKYCLLGRSKTIVQVHGPGDLCGIVDDPPRRYGLGRTPWRRAWVIWGKTMHAELAARLGAYRKAHWIRGDDDAMEGMDVLGGDGGADLERQ